MTRPQLRSQMLEEPEHAQKDQTRKPSQLEPNRAANVIKVLQGHQVTYASGMRLNSITSSRARSVSCSAGLLHLSRAWRVPCHAEHGLLQILTPVKAADAMNAFC